MIIVENLPVPFDRRVWNEATTLKEAGYEVSIICPKSKAYPQSEETIQGIHIFRHWLPVEARGAWAYPIEYGTALFWQFVLSLRIASRIGFDVVHACNPPDLIFLIGVFYKVFGRKKFVFDQHDINPELYEAKFGRRDWLWKLLVLMEKLTFKAADISIATNNSYKDIAITRGKMDPGRVFIVRSGPNLERIKELPLDERWRNGRKFMVGYVGVISQSEGLDLLLAAIGHIVRVMGRSDIQFVVVGSGPEWPAIAELRQKMDLEEFVTLTGRVDDDALFTILSTADVCVNSDRVTTMNDLSTMNKIMEYMALGKPIVQFDVKEGRFSAQSASLYAKANDPADFGEKIVELIDDPKRRAEMGQFGRQRLVTQLSWEHEKPKLLSAYDRLFDKSTDEAG